MEHLQFSRRCSDERINAGFFLNGRWFLLANRAARLGYIDYSKWRGTWREHERERLILNDLERSLLVTNLERLPTAKSQTDLDILTTVRRIEMPWIEAVNNPQNIMDSLDQLLQDEKNNEL